MIAAINLQYFAKQNGKFLAKILKTDFYLGSSSLLLILELKNTQVIRPRLFPTSFTYSFLRSSHLVFLRGVLIFSSTNTIDWVFDNHPPARLVLSTFLVSYIFPSVFPLLLLQSQQTQIYLSGSYPPLLPNSCLLHNQPLNQT